MKPMQPAEQSQSVGLLIDFGQPEKIENNKNQEAEMFSQPQFNNNNNNPNTQQQSQDVYNHNHQVLNNLNINFGDNGVYENFQNGENNNNNLNPLNPMNNIPNNNVSNFYFRKQTFSIKIKFFLIF